MTSENPRVMISTAMVKMLKTEKEMPDSDLNEIVEAIDDFLFAEKETESNDEGEGKQSKTDMQVLKRWREQIKSVGEKIAETCEDNVDIVVDVLETIGECHWTAVGFLLVASVLDKWKRVKRNKKECLRLLKSMNDLAKVVLELRPLPYETTNTQAKIKESIHNILKGAMPCSKMMERKGFKGMMKAKVDNKELVEVRQDIEELRNILHVHISVCIFKLLIEKESGGTKLSVTDAQDGVVPDNNTPLYDASIVANQNPRESSRKRRRDTSSESVLPPLTPISKREKIYNTRSSNEGNENNDN